MRSLLRRFSGDEAAQLVEFALVLPMLLLVVLGIAEFGFIFQRYKEGRVPTTTTNPAVVVTDVTIPVSGGLPAINAKRVTVTYTHSYNFLPKIAGWFGASYTTVPLQAVAEMRKEAGS